MTEFPRFVSKAEAEGVNISEIRPLKEATLLVVGIIGVALVFFVVFAAIVEFSAPLISPALEYRLFGGWSGYGASSANVDQHEMQRRGERVLARLLATGTEPPFPIRLGINPSPEINAFALPGGLILVTTGLMENVQDDEELAFVIAHELGHFANRDHLKGLGRGVAMVVISGILGATGVGRPALKLIDHFDLLASRSMDRQQEIAADAYGLERVVSSFGGTQGGVAFLSRLEREGHGEGAWLEYLGTHPDAAERLIALSGKTSR